MDRNCSEKVSSDTLKSKKTKKTTPSESSSPYNAAENKEETIPEYTYDDSDITGTNVD